MKTISLQEQEWFKILITEIHQGNSKMSLHAQLNLGGVYGWSWATDTKVIFKEQIVADSVIEYIKEDNLTTYKIKAYLNHFPEWDEETKTVSKYHIIGELNALVLTENNKLEIEFFEDEDYSYKPFGEFYGKT